MYIIEFIYDRILTIYEMENVNILFIIIFLCFYDYYYYIYIYFYKIVKLRCSRISFI